MATSMCQRHLSFVVRSPMCRTLSSSSTVSPLKRNLGMAFFSTIVAGTGCLGVWQTQRYYWKKQLIAEREATLKGDPMDVNVALYDGGVDKWEYHPVRCEGRLLTHKSMLLGPRTPPKHAKTARGLGTNTMGFFVITPMLLPDGTHILVDRGWVPMTQLKQFNSLVPRSDVVVTGVIRRGETPSHFTPENDYDNLGVLLWMNLKDVAAAAELPASPDGVPPLLVQCVHEEDVADGNQSKLSQIAGAGGGSGGRRSDADVLVRRTLQDFSSFHVTPDTHVGYAATWYSLAAFGTVATFMLFRRGSSGGAAAAVSSAAKRRASTTTAATP